MRDCVGSGAEILACLGAWKKYFAAAGCVPGPFSSGVGILTLQTKQTEVSVR
jgi:hypothetical protein